MRNLLIIGMLLIAASAAGWFRINRDGDRTLIEINQNEIRNDARNAINRGREYLQRGEQLATQELTTPMQQPMQTNQATPPNQQIPWRGEQVASEPQTWQYDSHWQPQATITPSQQQPAGTQWQQPYAAPSRPPTGNQTPY